MIFRARQFSFVFPRPALVMGILNVTPDSFSDAGQNFEVARAVARGEELAAEGADLLDVGGESTRPGAVPVSEAEEMRRVLPVIEALAARVAIPLSIDTMKPAVARAAVAAGADGLLIEVHPDPARALSDGAQSLTFAEFKDLMSGVRAVAAAIGRSVAGPVG